MIEYPQKAGDQKKREYIMNREELMQTISEPPAPQARVDVVFRPEVTFYKGDTEVDWNTQVEEVKTWMSTVEGRAHVSKRNGVVFTGNRGLICSDTYHRHEEPSDPMSYSVPAGTIIQAGISITQRNGFRDITAAVGIVVEPPIALSERDYAVTHGRNRTHRSFVQMDNVVQLSPEDAALICRLRQEIVEHGEDHVRRFLELVADPSS